MLHRLRLAVPLAALLVPLAVSAQDVEMLGRHYGTRPPDGYFERMARDPDAFRFSRGRAARSRSVIRLDDGAAGAPARALGPRSDPVVGDIRVPVVLGAFADVGPPALSAATISVAYFGPGATVSTYYAEVSSDSITLTGDVADWVQSSLTQSQVTAGVSALGGRIGDFVEDLLGLQSPAIDWGLYDNDGPDGVPDSGDDDGYVDALAIIQPTRGAECDGSPDRIWSHKWSLTEAGVGAFVTGHIGANGSAIRVDDYFVQGALDCAGTGLNEIGVFVHETGHAFGLPDLYDTRGSGGHQGAGNWDVMATGTWGCNDSQPDFPCHLGAWSKAALGWVDVVTLPPGTDFGTLVLPPVETSGSVYRVDAQDGSGEYYLFENRRGMPGKTFDQNLRAPGLLVWQIDSTAVLARWGGNTVNSSDHMGVWLRQADGLDELRTTGGDRGDAGDPFPGVTNNTAFHGATVPAARTFAGAAAGLSMLGIAYAGNDVSFDLSTVVTSLPAVDVDLVATVPANVQLQVMGGTAPISWSLVATQVPSGLSFTPDGRITGSALAVGTFPVNVEATDALGLTASGTVTLNVAAPSIAIGPLASAFLLSGTPLDSIQAVFLDRQGNDDGTYDVGDFRAWVLANPSLPLTAGPLGSPVGQPRRVTLPARFEDPEVAP